MNEAQEIVAYRYKGEWFTADEVREKRHAERDGFADANPYTVAALRSALAGLSAPCGGDRRSPIRVVAYPYNYQYRSSHMT